MAGTGTGTVTSDPAGIDCGTTCSAEFATGTVVTLTAAPDAGSTFAGWGGDASTCGAALTCQVTVNAATNVTATFATVATGEGCTRTIGYWKNHRSATAALLPQWLGTSGGASSVEVTSPAQASSLLHKAGSQNGIASLRAQLLGAKLNVASGADPTDVVETIAEADEFLASHSLSDWSDLTKAERRQVRAWAETLDDYNRGVTGPGHCIG
jgi:hypothetical protein